MYKIITDGSCDLSQGYLDDNQIINVPFYISFGNKLNQKEGVDLEVREFYQDMIDNPKIFPKTSTPSIGDYLEAMKPQLESGFDLIVICITSKFSGSYNAACNAREMLGEEYPQRRITVLDSNVNTVLQGLLLKQLVRLKNQGHSIEQLVDYFNENIKTARIFFTIGSMDYLVHGGRVGKLSSIAASVLSIKPIICLKEGEIFNEGLKRGRKKALTAVIDKCIEYFRENGYDPDNFDFVIGYGYDYDEALKFREKVLSEFSQNLNIEPETIAIEQIGATIAVHTGPYPLGLGLIRK